ncbi:glutaredoxin domain-containing protein [Chloroflexota bacterium]
MEVKVYSTPTCGYCHQVKRYLSDKGIKFTEYDVSVDRVVADEMVKLTGQTGVPVIVVDDQAVIGFNRAQLDQLLANSEASSAKKPSFGLSVANADDVVHKFDIEQVSGAFIGKVAPNSPGEKLGLKNGDIITEVNSRTIKNADDLENALKTLSKGSRVSIGFIRNNTLHNSEITV